MEIKGAIKELLEEGNRYTFAEVFIEKYPQKAKANGWSRNNYQAWVDWHPEDKSYTVWHKNGDKAFFDCELNCTGYEEY